MPNTTTDAAAELAELREKITNLTGKEPSSDDPVYLRQRLAQLKKRRANGEQVKHRKTGTAPLSASMPIDARKAVDKILGKEKIGASAFVLRAAIFWARANGYEAEARAMEAA